MTHKKPQSTASLLKHHNPRKVKGAKKLRFVGIKSRDIYNVTAPIKIKRTYYLLGRVEPREEETGSKILFFRRQQHSKSWRVDNKCPIFDLQDPFVTEINKTIILGGVETLQRTTRKHLSYRTVFYKGKDIHSLRKFSHGPWGMKGIRLIQLPDKTIFVFTRPQGKIGRRGKIGCMIINSLAQLTSRKLSRADLLSGQFARGEWGGVNEIHMLEDGKLGILGHIAKFSKGKKRHYYPITFSLDLETGAFSKIKIIARRSDLPKGESKRSDLYDVIYPGGIIRKKNGFATLYAGVGDAEAYEITIEDPFLEYLHPGEEFEEQTEIEQQLALSEQIK